MQTKQESGSKGLVGEECGNGVGGRGTGPRVAMRGRPVPHLAAAVERLPSQPHAQRLSKTINAHISMAGPYTGVKNHPSIGAACQRRTEKRSHPPAMSRHRLAPLLSTTPGVGRPVT